MRLSTSAQTRRGVDMGPSAIRYAGLEERLGAMGHTVSDRGNVVAPEPEAISLGDERARFLPEILDACAELAALVQAAVAEEPDRSFSAVTTRSRSGRSRAWPGPPDR